MRNEDGTSASEYISLRWCRWSRSYLHIYEKKSLAASARRPTVDLVRNEIITCWLLSEYSTFSCFVGVYLRSFRRQLHVWRGWGSWDSYYNVMGKYSHCILKNRKIIRFIAAISSLNSKIVICIRKHSFIYRKNDRVGVVSLRKVSFRNCR